ncbi:MAG: carbohydrate ABC transporter permease [Blautia sp.]|uniref:carbohydrate ABC transporter permease n=1 Tax=Blautia sp. TaxID=1955243 RepID=UPI002E75B2D8|nr:carbohydrate ABC transporter permease [Blautia sp.]MED9882435.1 carbohydrate ABC transporter permease [Blautia sp.]
MKENKISILKILCMLVIAALLVLAIYPVVWLILSAFKTQNEFTMNSAFSLPESFAFDNFIKAWTTGNMGTSFVNSLITTFGSMILVVAIVVPVSFAIAKMRFRLRNSINRYIMIGMMVPVQVALIPLFTIYTKLGWTNSRIGLILIYTAYSLPLSVILMTGFFESVPNEMIEAAVIDGCNIYQVLLKIVFPLMTNSIMTVLTLQFMSSWNDLIFSQTLISQPEKQTIQTALIMFNGSYGQVDWGPLFAAMAIAVIPTLVLYLFLSKFMIRGMTAGAVKG